MLKIGVLGAGHLGKIHLKLLQEIECYELVGFYDPDDDNAAQAIEKFGITRFESLEALIGVVDVVDIVTPTLSHYELAVMAIREHKHIFIEKPLTNTVEEAKSLIKLAEEADIKAQVGHVERFNPAFLSVKDIEMKPMFIEAHRLAQFNPRGTDVSVVLDLMIHDLDIILSLVNSGVKRISANGVSVISKEPDIANCRIEFDNGCVANITASRMSMKQMRKIRLFQQSTYISIDLLDKKSEIFSLNHVPVEGLSNTFDIETGKNGETSTFHYQMPEVENVNSIKMELELFAECIQNGTEPEVTLMDGYNALNVAHQILAKIEKNSVSYTI